MILVRSHRPAAAAPRRCPGAHRAQDVRRRGLLAETARTLLIASLVTVVSLGAWVVLPLLWGWDAYTVTSGSMAPLVQPGDVVVAAGPDPDDRIEVGAVLVLAPPQAGGEPVTHRVVEMLPDGRIRTKGDANPQADTRLVARGQVIGVARLVVPLAGQIQLHLGRAAPVAGILLIVVSLALPPVLGRRTGAPGRHRHTAAVLAATLALGPATAWTSTRALFAGVSPAATSTFATSYFYAAAIRRSGPLSYWRMGGASASSVADEMGLAALPMFKTPTTGRPGALTVDPNTSTRFTAGSGYAAVKKDDYGLAGPMSVAAWTNAVPTSATWRLVFKGNTTKVNYLLSWDTSFTSMRFLADVGGSRPTTSATWPTGGGWHFVVGVYDGSFLRLYIDGVPVGTPAAASGAMSVDNNLALWISEDTGTPMTGDVDEVAVWNKALTAAQIANFWAIARQ